MTMLVFKYSSLLRSDSSSLVKSNVCFIDYMGVELFVRIRVVGLGFR
jgi:hypothetical protein